MSEEAEFLEERNLPSLPEDGKTGIRMLEPDSIDRFIDGLKNAAEGCMHLHYWRDDRDDPLWQILATAFDAIRLTFARIARSKASDQEMTRDPGAARQSQIESYLRVDAGLKDAARAARQLASGHRGDLRWTVAANKLDAFQQSASRLARKRQIQSASPSILLPN